MGCQLWPSNPNRPHRLLNWYHWNSVCPLDLLRHHGQTSKYQRTSSNSTRPNLPLWKHEIRPVKPIHSRLRQKISLCHQKVLKNRWNEKTHSLLQFAWMDQQFDERLPWPCPYQQSFLLHWQVREKSEKQTYCQKHHLGSSARPKNHLNLPQKVLNAQKQIRLIIKESEAN